MGGGGEGTARELWVFLLNSLSALGFLTLPTFSILMRRRGQLLGTLSREKE